jgi:hypothetical protein
MARLRKGIGHVVPGYAMGMGWSGGGAMITRHLVTELPGRGMA